MGSLYMVALWRLGSSQSLCCSMSSSGESLCVRTVCGTVCMRGWWDRCGHLPGGLGSWVAREWVGCDLVAGPMCFSGRWRREVRIKKGCHRWQGETWYYGPCGKRMKQFPEVIKVTAALVAFKGLWLALSVPVLQLATDVAGL